MIGAQFPPKMLSTAAVIRGSIKLKIAPLACIRPYRVPRRANPKVLACSAAHVGHELLRQAIIKQERGRWKHEYLLGVCGRDGVATHHKDGTDRKRCCAQYSEDGERHGLERK
jgi:hypothetical protein